MLKFTKPFLLSLSCIIALSLLSKSGTRGEIQNLQGQLLEAKSDTSKIDLQIELAKLFMQLNDDTSLLYANQAIKAADQIKERNRLMIALMIKGILFKNEHRYKEAIEEYKKALLEAEMLDNRVYIAKIYNNMGTAYRKMNKRVEASEYFSRALEIKLALGERKSLPTTYDNIAHINIKIGKSNEALEGYLEALRIRKELKDSVGISKSYQNLGFFYRKTRSFDEAIENFNKALKINEGLGRTKSMITNYKSIGTVYRRRGLDRKSLSDFQLSLEMNRKALSLAEKIEDAPQIASCMIRVGDVYTHIDSLDESYLYLVRGYKFANQLNSSNLKLESLLALTQNATAQNDYRKAIEYATECKVYAEKSNDLADLKEVYKELSIAYDSLKQSKNALENYRMYYALTDSLLKVENATRLAEKRAMFDFEQQKNDIANLQKANELIEQQRALERYLLLLGILATGIIVVIMYRANRVRKRSFEIVKAQKIEVEKQRDKVKEKSEELQMSYHTIENLSIIGKEIISNLDIAAVNQSVYKHLKELMDLKVFGINLYDAQKDNLLTIGMMEDGNVLPDHETKISIEGLAGYCFIKGEEIHINDYAQEYQLYIPEKRTVQGQEMNSIVYIPLVHAGDKLGVLTVQHTNKNAFNGNHLNIIRNIANYSAIAIDNAHKYAQLEDQKDKISAQKHETEESIRYAQNIQNSLLPSSVYLNEMLADFFVLYEPCQIVSGDFYWAHQLEDGRKIIMVADCTGHGVPGAMLSMISITQLNEIVINNHVTDPAKILDELRLMIISSMKTQEKQRDDSLDCTVILLDEANQKIEVAGAFNKMFHALSAEEIVDYDVSRQPVGNYPVMEPFTSTSIEYKKGDVIYLMSDGYYDQIGGPRMKKYGAKRMKNTLLEMYSDSMEHQKATLTDIIGEWEKELFQLDDRCVIGIRL